ncbi:hypothetical protein DO021_00745 [Desulfobacter hydrogenophilus]|uniref:PEP-CTERM sorting domain-containing protein n=1 Tax=Desulfobacter hydrogenophilus TaxID=2291 RepID=A0A328FKI8_9BACT|nr:PEP-CTERM sorting domain-containing protein [Desulfobacter hydrogenophilus]NDY72768.1 PEP-CTERM sorting domain-containing protein [Desulfobacter hydrogenophilus]QBH12998.1 PEP-CTERM sorting domain-containing protein [Desulfobacter hydrogenophilus]RAM03982.1 hypothetical protein DO021_00745 [Desulfobacter hydrogenophilus]
MDSGLDETFNVFNPFTLIGEKDVNLDFGATTSFGPVAITNSGALTPTDLNQFVGSGDFGYDFNTAILTSISGGGGNFSTDIETMAGASLTVVYDYDVAGPTSVVPEPATLLFGLSLMGLAHRCRRKNA